MAGYRKLPYGITDYDRIAREDYYYVDKTHFIPLLEDEPPFLFLIRPRRFGKSLLLSILQDYYDLGKKDQFEALFGSTYIGKNPTKERNKYLVLSFNFSQVKSEEAELEASFESHCLERFTAFNSKYAGYFPAAYLAGFEQKPNSSARLGYICTQCSEQKLPLYIILDEYDNFANTILSSSGGEARYRRLTHGDGFFRHFFAMLKGGATGSDAGISRMFITGVSPLTMDDVTSGFNIGWNITNDERFNGLVGFSEEEVKEMIGYYRSAGVFGPGADGLLPLLSAWYNSYRFSASAEDTMYNSDMVLYFLNAYLPLGKHPGSMVDTNVKTDYNKLRHLVMLDKKIGKTFSILKDIYETGSIAADIIPAFSVLDLDRQDSFVSLLYYFGLLTIAGTVDGQPLLQIPNHAIRSLWGGYICRAYDDAGVFRVDPGELAQLMRAMAYRGDWKPVFEFIANKIEEYTSIRDFIKGEQMVKGFLMAYLGLPSHYILRPEYEMNKGYADLYLEPFFVQHKEMPFSYIIELKYLPREGSKPVSKAKLKSQLKDAQAQLLQYADAPYIIESKGNTTLKKLALVWHGWELVGMEEY